MKLFSGLSYAFSLMKSKIGLGIGLVPSGSKPPSELYVDPDLSWSRHQMETFSALLAICAGNSPVPVEFPAQRPVTRSFYVFFDLSLNKRLSKRSWGWWFETPTGPLWRHYNVSPYGVTRLHELTETDIQNLATISKSQYYRVPYIGHFN